MLGKRGVTASALAVDFFFSIATSSLTEHELQQVHLVMKKASFVVFVSLQISQTNGTSFGFEFCFDDSPFSSLILLCFPKEVFLGTKLRILTPSSSSSSISERLMTTEVVAAMGKEN